MASRARRRKDQPWNPPSTGPDISTVFVLFAAGPLLLPVVGANASMFSRVIAVLAMTFALVKALGASRRAPDRRRAWLAIFVAAGLGIAGTLTGAASALGVPAEVPRVLGGVAALGLLSGVAMLAFQSLRGIRLDHAVDALLLALVAVGAGVYLVAVPSFRDGSVLTTSSFVVDLVAVFAASLAVVASDPARRRMSVSMLAATGFITSGHAVSALAAAGAIAPPAGMSRLLFAGAAVCIGLAASLETGRPAKARSGPDDNRWVYVRVIAPLAGVLAFPAMALTVWAIRGIEHWELAYFGAFSTLLLVLAFGRQARLLVDNRTAMTRERGLREQVMRRNEDLEAVTGLATTMTQTLEELPIVERGLEVLHLAARASSSALHDGDGRSRLVACAGDWHRERTWVDHVPEPEEGAGDVSRRGGREIVQLPLAARGNDIGMVTVLRPSGQPFESGEVELLRVLAGQLAIAIQNARDYREKLEQAVRDPLTGLYNRRYFFEALEKEVHRAKRYGSHASLVIFDVDDFKRINDTLGHTAGDEALRKIARIVRELIRDVDSFARIGGEEFALLLPEAQQLDALLVAERVRTGIAGADILPDRRVTVSGGVSSCPHDGDTREALEKKADAALYWAKRNGKNICALSSEATEQAMEVGADGMLAHLTAMVSAIETNDLHRRGHSENVASYAGAIAQELGLDADGIMRVRRAGLLHDLGKVAVPRRILEKPSPLDPREYEQVQLHADVGATMLLHAGFEDEAAWVRSHHERIDGLGYPDGLAGGEIPLESRILLVADAFDAMTSDRPYRPAVEPDDAVSELRACAGTQFDEDVVEALARLLERNELDVLPAPGWGVERRA